MKMIPKAMDMAQKSRSVPIQKSWGEKSCYILMFSQVLSNVWLPTFSFFPKQFDADRDEEEVFFDISSAVDNKLFANKEATAGELM